MAIKCILLVMLIYCMSFVIERPFELIHDPDGGYALVGQKLLILWSVQFRFVCTSSLLHHAITATGNTKICCRDTDRWIQIWTLARSTSLKCEKHSTYQCATYQRTTFRAWLPPPNIHMRLINHVHTFYRGYILMWSSWIKTTKT